MPFIEIEHPNLPKSKSKVDEQAFELVWKAKGWVRVEDTPVVKKKKPRKTTKPKTVVKESTNEPDDTLP